MLGLDTNVLVRFLVQDDQAQFGRAQKLIGRESRTGSGVLISLLVLLETEWVLRSRYSLAKSEILAAFSGLLASAELRFDDEHSIEEVLFAWKDSPADFADCLIGARHRALGCRATASFDAKATKLPGFVAA
jgi:predicted nucleic-acid-binding protein